MADKTIIIEMSTPDLIDLVDKVVVFVPYVQTKLVQLRTGHHHLASSHADWSGVETIVIWYV